MEEYIITDSNMEMIVNKLKEFMESCYSDGLYSFSSDTVPTVIDNIHMRQWETAHNVDISIKPYKEKTEIGINYININSPIYDSIECGSKIVFDNDFVYWQNYFFDYSTTNTWRFSNYYDGIYRCEPEYAET